MRIPLILLALSAMICAVGVVVPGYADALFLGLITGAAALFLTVQALWRRRARAMAPSILLDGSNVMHWNNGQPSLEPVREVLTHLRQQGYQPGVVFDANAGYKLEGRYRNHREMAQQLGLSPDYVLVVNKGVPADRFILQFAQDHDARVVTNDRFRDWAAQFPDVSKPGYLVSGAYRGGALTLNL
ncbi:MAG: hypothetical protein EA338_07020 [Roseinatronobacter sp.]|nr:MAG: hypothetical protein EA338_07020 [Roseinatronobacter sp.]